MWDAYWQTVRTSDLDWFILFIGSVLGVFHLGGLYLRYEGKHVAFVQGLDRYRTFLLLLTEILPVLGLLGTVFSLMYTFQSFQTASEGDSVDISQMVRAFSPALSTTISGLMTIGPNLVLNAMMWLACPRNEKGSSES